MEEIYFTHIVMLATIILSALYLGWLLTETRHRIADKHWLLNRKPFSCRPCLTFHLGWILSGIAALFINNLPFFAMGLSASFATWLILEIENRNKIDK
ncbi:hypothetical protein LJC00_03145 [Dysgonomonas sp. OttesenSCG-928-M03]|nr:hypothetical protein [Dysgonomonas sp. OttesenSCG-928-M03]